MDRKEIIRKVLVKLDEFISGDNQLVVFANNAKTQPASQYADELLDDCALEMAKTLPTVLLPVKSFVPVKTGDTPTITYSNSIAKISVPLNLIRIVSIKFSEWERAVVELNQENSDIAKMQANQYVRAGYAKPVGVIKKVGTKKDIYCYTVDQVAQNIPEFIYISNVSPEELSDELIPALTSLCASKVFMCFERAELATAAFQQYSTNISIL
jgi:hypothetical protein